MNTSLATLAMQITISSFTLDADAPDQYLEGDAERSRPGTWDIGTDGPGRAVERRIASARSAGPTFGRYHEDGGRQRELAARQPG